MTLLAWAIILLLLGLALIVLEFFIPSGGLLGFLAACAVLGGVTLAYMFSPLAGFLFLGTAVIVVPIVLSVAVKLWPATPMGKRFLLTGPEPSDVLPDNSKRRQLQELVGKVGKAKSKMLPSGVAEFDGRTVDAVSEGPPIETDELVRVVSVRGSRVVVRPATADEANASPPPDDELSRPIESLGLDPFEDPLS